MNSQEAPAEDGASAPDSSPEGSVVDIPIAPPRRRKGANQIPNGDVKHSSKILDSGRDETQRSNLILRTRSFHVDRNLKSSLKRHSSYNTADYKDRFEIAKRFSQNKISALQVKLKNVHLGKEAHLKASQNENEYHASDESFKDEKQSAERGPRSSCLSLTSYQSILSPEQGGDDPGGADTDGADTDGADTDDTLVTQVGQQLCGGTADDTAAIGFCARLDDKQGLSHRILFRLCSTRV